MPDPKATKDKNGRILHHSVGALIFREGKYLLIDRRNKPLGYAGLAGHIDEGETPEEALSREVKEESRLIVTSHKLIDEGLYDKVSCVFNVAPHYWYLYVCEVEGEVRGEEDEAKSIGWFTKKEVAALPLESSWEHWFRKHGVI